MALWNWKEAFPMMLLIGLQTTPFSGGIITDCSGLDSQRSLDLDKLMGKWYAVEVVEHNRSVEHNTISTVINLCPTLQLTREGNSTIRLHWNESAGELVYKFRQPNAGHLGFWVSVGSQKGSLAERHDVTFSGTVLVMKAVSSHTVLTFCPRSQHKVYTVLMSRTRRLPYEEKRGVNNMLKRRGLDGLVKEMCKGAAVSNRGRLAAVALLLVVQFVSGWH